MRNKCLHITGFLLFWLCLSGFAVGQTARAGGTEPDSKELQRRKDKMVKELNSYTRLLQDANVRKDSSLATLELLTKQVSLRQELLGTLRAEVTQLDAEILAATAEITRLEGQLALIRKDFGTLMVLSYKSLYNRPKSFYLLSAQNVNDAYMQVRYFQEIEKVQKAQARYLERTRNEIVQKQEEIKAHRMERFAVLSQERAETDKLVAQQNAQKTMYNRLRKQAEEYQKSLAVRQNEINKIQTMIDEAVRREIALARKAEEERRARELAEKGTKPATTPKPGTKPAAGTGNAEPIGPPVASRDVLLPLTATFMENKKRLPWPVPSQTAVITKHFGRQMLGSGLEINSKGIEIATLQNQSVRSVFEGTVTDVLPVPLYDNMVIVSHGTIMTVYIGLQTVSVKKGDKLKTLQEIGTAKTISATGETKVQFQIFQGEQPQNPEEWLADKN